MSGGEDVKVIDRHVKVLDNPNRKEIFVPTLTTSTRLVLTVVVTTIALGVLAGCGSSESSVSVQLREESGSAQSGSATLTRQGDKTRVVVELSNPLADAQPSHIHRGSCARPNPAPAFPLNDVRNGKAATTVPVSLDALRGDERYYVNVHKSGAEIATIVACGDVEASDDDDGGGGGPYGGGY